MINTAGSSLLRAINLISLRVSHLSNEQRKPLFSSLQLLIEKSQDIELLTEITKMVGQWVLGNNNSTNNNEKQGKEVFSFVGKEKVMFLQKMTRYDQLNAPELQSLFLDLVYHVFNDPSSSRHEQGNLEAGFMMGLRSKDLVVRNNFFEVFHKSIAPVRSSYSIFVIIFHLFIIYFLKGFIFAIVLYIGTTKLGSSWKYILDSSCPRCYISVNYPNSTYTS